MNMMGSGFKQTKKKKYAQKILSVVINGRITCKIPLIISGTHFTTFLVFFSRQHFHCCSTLMPSSFQPRMKTNIYMYICMCRVDTYYSCINTQSNANVCFAKNKTRPSSGRSSKKSEKNKNARTTKQKKMLIHKGRKKATLFCIYFVCCV